MTSKAERLSASSFERIPLWINAFLACLACLVGPLACSGLLWLLCWRLVSMSSTSSSGTLVLSVRASSLSRAFCPASSSSRWPAPCRRARRSTNLGVCKKVPHKKIYKLKHVNCLLPHVCEPVYENTHSQTILDACPNSV